MKDVLSYLDHRAQRGGELHLSATRQMQGESRAAMFWPSAFTARAVRKVREQLRQVAQNYIETIGEIIASDIHSVSKDARMRALEHLSIETRDLHSDAFYDALSEFEDASFSIFSSEIASQTTRDLGQVLKRYRNHALRVLMLADVRHISREEARDQVISEESDGGVKLWFRDSAYRKIPSHKFARKLWRQVLRDHWVQVYMKTLAEYGDGKAVVWHEDPKHGSFGIELNAAERDYGLEDLDSVFHPNAGVLPVAKKFMETVR